MYRKASRIGFAGLASLLLACGGDNAIEPTAPNLEDIGAVAPAHHDKGGHAGGGGDGGGKKTETVEVQGDVTAGPQSMPGDNTDRWIRLKGDYTLTLTFTDPDDLSLATCKIYPGGSSNEDGVPYDASGLNNQTFTGELEIEVDKSDLSNLVFVQRTDVDGDGEDDLLHLRNPTSITLDPDEETGSTMVIVKEAIFRWFIGIKGKTDGLVKCPGVPATDPSPGVADYTIVVSK